MRKIIVFLLLMTTFTALSQNYVQQGDEYLSQSQYEKAIKKFTAAIEMMGESHQITQKISMAKQCLPILVQAQQAEQNDNWSQAASLYEKLYDLHPLDSYKSKATGYRQKILAKQQQEEQARRDAEEAERRRQEQITLEAKQRKEAEEARKAAEAARAKAKADSIQTAKNKKLKLLLEERRTALRTEKQQIREDIIQKGIYQGIPCVDMGMNVAWATTNNESKNGCEDPGRYYSSPSENIFIRGKWRTPTRVDYEILLQNCDAEYEKINKTKCLKLSSKVNGKNIIFPPIDQKKSNTPDKNLYWTKSPIKKYGEKWYYAFSWDKKGTCGLAYAQANNQNLPIRYVVDIPSVTSEIYMWAKLSDLPSIKNDENNYYPTEEIIVKKLRFNYTNASNYSKTYCFITLKSRTNPKYIENFSIAGDQYGQAGNVDVLKWKCKYMGSNIYEYEITQVDDAYIESWQYNFPIDAVEVYTY